MIVNYPRMRRRAAWPNDLNTALEFVADAPFSIKAGWGKRPTRNVWDGEMQYTNGHDWKTWNSEKIQAGKLNDKYYLYIRGINNHMVTDEHDEDLGYANWELTGSSISCNGNIEKLLDWQTVQAGNHPEMWSSCFEDMFKACNALISAPDLPAIDLADRCYKGMFAFCRNFVTAPLLPATTLKDACYQFMFSGCSSLATVHRLPATDLPYSCYDRMYDGCKKIKLSTEKTGLYNIPFRIPSQGTGVLLGSFSVNSMFGDTGGTFTGTPEINTTYYLDESNTIV